MLSLLPGPSARLFSALILSGLVNTYRFHCLFQRERKRNLMASPCRLQTPIFKHVLFYLGIVSSAQFVCCLPSGDLITVDWAPSSTPISTPIRLSTRPRVIRIRACDTVIGCCVWRITLRWVFLFPNASCVCGHITLGRGVLL